MKTIFLAIIFTSLISHCLAQKVERNLYAEALSACLSKEAADFSKLGLERDYNNRVVEYDYILTSKLPTQFGGIKVEYLNTDMLVERYKKNRKEVEILSMRPMQSDGANLTVNIPYYFFSSKKRNFNYALAGGCNVEFNYDSQKKQFTLAKTVLWGV